MQREILDFWFGPAPHAARDAWFRKDAAFDATIRERFGAMIDAALAGGLRDWAATPHGALARDAGLDGPLDWACRHEAVVRRFGRFPHRNSILGRASTAEEIEFLGGPGSRF
jgi:uncharacterized protein (DUF924 family)